tara:strand:+ start:2271 stop:3599 length:1329 start_codon:yes stop_codon:yes gene_type:complete
MNCKWIEANLGDFVLFKNGKSSPNRDDSNNIPVFGSNGVIGYSCSANTPSNSLIVGRVGSYCGSVYYSYEKCWVTDNAIMGLPKYDREFEFWYFFLLSLNLNSYRSGSGQPLINQATLKSISIRVPEKSEERAQIGKKAMLFNSKIEANTQTNQTLEQIAQALFKSWFVDFDPVKAKIEILTSGGSEEDSELAAMSVIAAKSIDELNELKQSKPEAFDKIAQTAELFPSAIQDSELGDIPAGWRVSEIGKEVVVVGGGTPSTKLAEFWDDGDIHWTTPKDMSNLNSKVLLNTDRKITKLGLKKISSGLLPVNTVLMSSRAPVGYLALAKIPVAINQGYIAMKCEDILSPEFVMLWCEQNMDEIKQRASGTTFAEISKSNFKPIPIVIPCKYLIGVFTDQVSEIYNLIANTSCQSHSLSEIRNTLLPRLLSGDFIKQFDSEAQ